jgi:hypothetical protein
MSISSSDVVDLDSDYLPSEDEQTEYDSDNEWGDEMSFELFQQSPVNGMEVISEAPYLIKMPLPYV